MAPPQALWLRSLEPLGGKRTHEAGGNGPEPGCKGVLMGAEEWAIGNHIIGPTIEVARRALYCSRKLPLTLCHGGRILLSAKTGR